MSGWLVAKISLIFGVLFSIPLSLCAEEILRGELQVEVSTNSDGRISKNFYLKQSANEREYRQILVPTEREPAVLKLSGKRVEVHLDTESGLAIQISEVPLSSALVSAALAPQSAYQKYTVGVLIVEFPGIPSLLTRSSVDTMIMGTGQRVSSSQSLVASLRTSNVRRVFEESSTGMATIRYPAGMLREHAIQGPYVIQKKKGERCEQSFRSWSNRALGVARKNGFNPLAFDHVIFMFPSHHRLGCSVVGKGEVNGRYSWIFKPKVNAIVHELGHNLGLMHASRESSDLSAPEAAYGDYSTPMGALNPYPVLFNAPERLQLGWYNRTSSRFRDTAAYVRSITEPGIHRITLNALEWENPNPSQRKYRILRVSIPGRERAYVLSYRRANKRVPEWLREFQQGVSVHRDKGEEEDTELLSVLTDSQKLVLFEDNLRITQLRHDESEVELEIELGALPDQVASISRCYLLQGCEIDGRGGTQRCSQEPLSPGDFQILANEVMPQCRVGGTVIDDRGHYSTERYFDPNLDGDEDGIPNLFDCARADPTAWRLVTCRDSDGDGFRDYRSCNGSAGICAGTEISTGWVIEGGKVDNCTFVSNTNQKDSDRDGIGDACDDPSTEKEKKVGSRVLREQTLNFIEVARSFKGQNLQRYAIRVLSLFAPLIERAMSNRTARNLEKIKSLQEDLERATQRHPLSKKDYRRLLKRTKNKLEIKVEKEK